MNSARSFALTAPIESIGSLWDGAWASLVRLTHSHTRYIEAVPGGLRISGALDKRNARELKRVAKVLAESDGLGFGIDLSRVDSWDGDGLAALVYALDVCELSGKRLQLIEPCSGLRHLLERSQLHHLFAIVHRDELAA